MPGPSLTLPPPTLHALLQPHGPLSVFKHQVGSHPMVTSSICSALSQGDSSLRQMLGWFPYFIQVFAQEPLMGEAYPVHSLPNSKPPWVARVG